ncbi:ATP-binding cassette domain-containing protein [Rugosimonospora acidiphila]|uniref:ATP-binding cassette domain-containing protein n=1 Tax=Rugosimonospora acidiphila TaxID=556531 RepID=UPI0031EAD6DC
MGRPLLELTGVSKRFGAVNALADIRFTARAGEIVALVGDNGAGKSTLIKAISGVQPADEGTFVFDGQRVSPKAPTDVTRLGIATVYQDLALADNLDVVGNLFLGRERLFESTRRIVPLMDKVSMAQQAKELLAGLGARIPNVLSRVESLSGGQRQAVAIARALLGEPKLILLDEPTAALGVTQTAHVLELTTTLKRRGLAVVLISHNLSDVFAVADRISVLRLGRNGGDFTVADTTREAVVAAITGLAADTPATAAAAPGQPTASRQGADT